MWASKREKDADRKEAKVESGRKFRRASRALPSLGGWGGGREDLPFVFTGSTCPLTERHREDPCGPWEDDGHICKGFHM